MRMRGGWGEDWWLALVRAGATGGGRKSCMCGRVKVGLLRAAERLYAWRSRPAVGPRMKPPPSAQVPHRRPEVLGVGRAGGPGMGSFIYQTYTLQVRAL